MQEKDKFIYLKYKFIKKKENNYNYEPIGLITKKNCVLTVYKKLKMYVTIFY